MDIQRKFEYAKQHIDSIAGHDDAPEAEVAAALQSLRNYADGRLKSLVADREARKPVVPETEASAAPSA